jgi:hypothetical protein
VGYKSLSKHAAPTVVTGSPSISTWYLVNSPQIKTRKLPCSSKL